VKNQDFIGKTNFFLSTMPFNPWAASTTWLHVRALRKYKKNELNTLFQQKFAMGSYGVRIGPSSWKACELPKQQSTSFWSQGILGVN
jgi:hypothetical protein